MYSSH